MPSPVVTAFRVSVDRPPHILPVIRTHVNLLIIIVLQLSDVEVSVSRLPKVLQVEVVAGLGPTLPAVRELRKEPQLGWERVTAEQSLWLARELPIPHGSNVREGVYKAHIVVAVWHSTIVGGRQDGIRVLLVPLALEVATITRCSGS